ncbi:unnamed protein product [Prunus armeniaca]
MEIRLVACERMSGTQRSKKTPLSLCFVKQPVCNGDEACRLRALVACERMSGTKCSKKTPLSLCFVKQLVCSGDEACRLRAYVRDIMLEKDSIEFVLREAACLQWRLGLSPASVCQGHNARKRLH